MPDLGNLGNRLPDDFDLEKLMELVGKLQEVIPEDLQMDLLTALMSSDVQAAQKHIVQAGMETKDALTALLETEEFANLAMAAMGLQGGLTELLEALPEDLAQSLVAALPQVGKTLGEMYKTSSAFAGARGVLAMAMSAGYTRPESAAVSQAVTSLAYAETANSQLPAAHTIARDFLDNPGYNGALREIVAAFAKARGVSYYDELGRWTLDAQGLQVPTNAVNRFLDADPRTSQMDAFDRVRLASTLTRDIESAFSGLQSEWVENGDTPELAITGTFTGRALVTGFQRAINTATVKPISPPENTL